MIATPAQTAHIEIDRLRLYADDNPRTEPEPDRYHVESLKSVDPETWPPLIVTPWSDQEPDQYAVIDGRHRLVAAHELGLGTLPCRVEFDLDWEEGYAYNRLHGLPPSPASRRQHVHRLRARYPDMAVTEIAKRVGVTQARVSQILSEGDSDGISTYGRAPNRNPAISALRSLFRAYQGRAGRKWFGLRAEIKPETIDEFWETVPLDEETDALHMLVAYRDAVSAWLSEHME